MSNKIMYLLDAYTSTGLTVGCRGDEIYNSNTGEILKPDADIIKKAETLEADYVSNQYQRDRATSYPSIQEQLDMQYWDSVNGTTTWKDAIAKVKTDNPKPSE